MDFLLVSSRVAGIYARVILYPHSCYHCRGFPSILHLLGLKVLSQVAILCKVVSGLLTSGLWQHFVFVRLIMSKSKIYELDLMLFARLSGLKVNFDETSMIYLGVHMASGLVLAFMHCDFKSLPIRYQGGIYRHSR